MDGILRWVGMIAVVLVLCTVLRGCLSWMGVSNWFNGYVCGVAVVWAIRHFTR